MTDCNKLYKIFVLNITFRYVNIQKFQSKETTKKKKTNDGITF